MGMTVIQFFDSKKVTEKELNRTFRLEKKLDIDAIAETGCLSCGDHSNRRRLPSEDWTGAYQCTKCDTLVFIVFTDRMSGNHLDTVYLYKQR